MTLADTGEDARFTVERLRWIDPGSFVLRLGDRVAVQDDDAVWIGEVVVPAERVLEWTEIAALPVVVRLATEDERPAPHPTDGRRLLDSLGYARALLTPD